MFNRMDIKRWFHKICQSVWAIGFIESDIDDILAGKPYQIKWVDVPADCWYADPFILKVTDNIIELLVEKWSYEEEKGSITKMIIDRNSNKIIDSKDILKLDTHLSFPVIYRIEGNIIVCPENSASGCHQAYKYDEKDETLTLVKCICPLPLTDAVMTELLGERILFATQSHDANGNKLDVFKWNAEDGIFVLSSSISFDEKIARMAGHFFEHDGVVYRPAQVCNTSYGQAVSLQRVEKKDDVIKMVEIRRLFSTHKRLHNGMHTFNLSQGIIVVDAWGWIHPFLRKLFVDDWGNMKSWVLWVSGLKKRSVKS